jgi:hypothetical protein
MNTLKFNSLALVLVAVTSLAHAQDATPAWQAAGYTMEEIVVTAQAPASPDIEDTEFRAAAAPELYMQEPVVDARIPLRLARLIERHRQYGGLL